MFYVKSKNMALKLDLKDRKLLYELDRNPRATISTLARRVGVSKQVALYRINSLCRQGVISTSFAITDAAKLGFTLRKAFVKLQNASEEEERALISWLLENKETVWVASCEGQYDLAFSLRAKNIEEYTGKLWEIDNRFGHLFLQRDIAPIVRGQYFYRDYLVGNQAGTDRELSFGSDPKQSLELDLQDWKMLIELGKNARAPITALAKATGTSPDAARKRLKRLESNGAINGYALVLGNPSIGQLHYKVFVRLKSTKLRRYKQLVGFCREHPNIFYIVKTFGVWEFEIDMEVPDSQAFRSVMRQLKSRFSDIMRDYSHISIYKIHKYNFTPSVPD